MCRPVTAEGRRQPGAAPTQTAGKSPAVITFAERMSDAQTDDRDKRRWSGGVRDGTPKQGSRITMMKF
ncbi:hypothetical protein EYF80_008809 [Liparis tanakae]|uniref:Uncharacterized protein n=1 Tax=Liparis tanakae TaxID=230148 RepID=A0A4Z2ITF5_9TELE|nr:hypothetical protein EYF80_008809 [Liparis tanakae]